MNNKDLQNKIATLRRDYSILELDEKSVMKDPVKQFAFWMEQAIEAEIEDPNAMTLATADSKLQPDVRIVLLRGFGIDGFAFYTNYMSKKGEELAANKKACINFFWPELQRQVRISGSVSKLSSSVSDEYFATRPRESQVGAWASMQSEKIKDRVALMKMFDHYAEKFRDMDVPRPPHWGGYLLKPRTFEFWQGRVSRLHDRIFFEKKRDGHWKVSRLAP